ncbi:4-alpha-glucanotransferase [Thermodesulfobacterium hydrogeniphilum]|uniref:4-alpha-glucanotransferase n=1 Tax=Thermodesulfobacterium hydrogeniphilum TaxID=161156 RepID=UPI000571E36C|nr:4-alpha-glucanotransferase [Thermodesulfobacterium hydrogeniphilum]
MSSGLKVRKAGIFLSISSLPSSFGIGDFGEEAYNFVDFLKNSGQSIWQILPINPTSEKFGNSPYHALSLYAGNYILINPEKLHQEGLLNKEELKDIPSFPKEKIEYKKIYKFKEMLLRKAYNRFKPDWEYEKFCQENKDWLEDYAFFEALRLKTDKEWKEWDEDLKKRKSSAIKSAKEKLKEEIGFIKFIQFIFFKQWFALKNYANSKGIHIIGDLPIYPAYESFEVWKNPKIFKLDKELKPCTVAGVPPDYFSKTGQLWGNPVYNWRKLKETSFEWWIKRIEHNLKLFDFIRLDHFRGFIAYWEIPAGEKTAVNGKWIKAPAEEFFERILKTFPSAGFIVEDLGEITEDVKYIKNKFDFPGMKVLEFAFYKSKSPYLLHNCERNSVIYTSTHDLPPVKAWFKKLDKKYKEKIFKYLGKKIKEREISWEMIRLAYMSRSAFVIIPMQDILSLGEEAIINTPAKPFGNWEWKMSKNYFSSELIEKLHEYVLIFER